MNDVIIVEQHVGIHYCSECWDNPENDDKFGWEISVHDGDRMVCHICQKVVGTKADYSREEVIDMLQQIYHELLLNKNLEAFTRTDVLIKAVEEGEI